MNIQLLFSLLLFVILFIVRFVFLWRVESIHHAPRIGEEQERRLIERYPRKPGILA